jgi:hypothetical protein
MISLLLAGTSTLGKACFLSLQNTSPLCLTSHLWSKKVSSLATSFTIVLGALVFQFAVRMDKSRASMDMRCENTLPQSPHPTAKSLMLATF